MLLHETIDIHCSSLPDWAICEKSKIEQMTARGDAPEEKLEHVAGWIGSSIHAMLASADRPDPPAFLVFDKITPTLDYAKGQIKAMAPSVAEAIEREGWEVARREVEVPPLQSPDWIPQLRLVGRMDVTGRTLTGQQRLIADIKTAHSIRPAWLQLGGYHACCTPVAGEIPRVATVHCPRFDLAGEEPKTTIYYADGPACAREAIRIMNRVSDLLEDAELAIAAPGNRCRRCEHPACPVRSQDQSPR